MAHTILVVDDELDAQKLLSLILARAGYQVLTASNGAEALAQAEHALPDLIILDVMMPAMDGYEVLRRLRAHPLLSSTPVIMLSAKGEVRDRVTGLRSGADDYIPKPADSAELVARVEAVLQRVQRSGAAQRGRVITLLGVKGGVGTTTVAVNVAAAFSRTFQVIVAELRLTTGTAAASLGLHPVRTVSDLLAEAPKGRVSGLSEALLAHPCGLRLLAAAPGFREQPSPDSPDFVDSLLDQLTQLAQFVLIDLSPDFPYATEFLMRAESVVFVANTDPLSLASLQSLLAYAAEHRLADRCRVVIVNRAPGTGLNLSTLSQTLKHPVLSGIPYAAEVCMASAREGKPLIIHRPNELASLALLDLAGRLTGVEVQEGESPRVLLRSSGLPPSDVSPFVFPDISRAGRSSKK